jgi:hypothetical protein
MDKNEIKLQTPAQYFNASFKAGKDGRTNEYHVCGEWYLCDDNFKILKHHGTYKTRLEAIEVGNEMRWKALKSFEKRNAK